MFEVGFFQIWVYYYYGDFFICDLGGIILYGKIVGFFMGFLIIESFGLNNNDQYEHQLTNKYIRHLLSQTKNTQ